MLYIPYPFKRCPKCGNEYPATREYYSPDKHGQYGLNCYCKCCRARLTAEWRANKPGYYHEYYVNNLEYHQERRKAYQETHRDDLRLRQSEYRQRPETKERQRDYDASHRKQHSLRQRAYRERHVDYYRQKAKQWHAEHPQESNTHHQRRVAKQRELRSDFSVKDWQRALDYFNHCCAVCGRPQGLWHTLAQDHWIPLSRGGNYTPDNIVPLCHGVDGCNNFKKDRSPEEWLNERYGSRKAKIILARITAYFEWIKQQ